MPTKPNPQVAETGESYVEAAVRAVKPAAVPLTAQQQAYLSEALADLADLDEYAKEISMPPPAPATIEAARAFLHKAVREAPRRYALCPGERGEVVVFAQGARGFRVSVDFEADGSALCFVIRPDSAENKKRRFPCAEEAACEWVFDSMREMKG